MAVIEYTEPKYWADKDMNWNAPNIQIIDYLYAVREAILERCNYAKVAPDAGIYEILPNRNFRFSMLTAIRASLVRIIPYFVDPNYDYFQKNAAIPKYYTLHDFLTEDVNFSVLPSISFYAHGDGQIVLFLKNVRAALNKMCWKVGDKKIVQSRQIDAKTEDTGHPHYSVQIASGKALERVTFFYAEGFADDCLQIIGDGGELYSDHDPDVHGFTHSYGGHICTIPANSSFVVRLWDTRELYIKWDGEFYLRTLEKINFKFKGED